MNLGEVLKSARTAAGLSLDDLSSITSIRPGLLGEMESNKFTHCGGDIYARGHLRNIAPKLNLDANHLVDLYNAEHSVESRSINELLAENSVTRVPQEKKNISWKVPAAFSIAILLVLGVAQIIYSNVNSSNSADPVVVESASPTPSPMVSTSPEPTPTASSSETPAAGGVKLSVVASRGNSSVDIVVDGQRLFKGSLFQGETKSFEATTSISVYFSNPAGLDVTVNGELLAPLGGQNQEVRRTFR
jgi:cytoskeletal protein RodZ